MSEGPSDLRHVRNRIAALRTAGNDPIEVVLSPETWARLQREYKAATPGLFPKLAVRDVLSVRGRLVAGAHGCTIRYFGGIDFPANSAVAGAMVAEGRSGTR